MGQIDSILAESWSQASLAPPSRARGQAEEAALRRRRGFGGEDASVIEALPGGLGQRLRTVSITFLNAMRPERTVFIATISTFFLGMGPIRLPLMLAFDLMTWELFRFSCVALLSLLAGMPLGAWLARRVSRTVFDRVILALLGAMAVKLVVEVAG